MNASSPWYRVPEMWLVLGLLTASVAASLALVVTAHTHPDAHIVQGGHGPMPPVVVTHRDTPAKP